MIKAPKGQGCFLCQKHSEDNDRENLVLERGKYCYCLMNLYPYNNGHLLIAPYRHTGDLADLQAEELNELMSMVQTWVGVIKKYANPQGFNIGMNVGTAGGAGTAEHLHMHIVPRWNGDTNFMTVFADTRVVCQSLTEARDELVKARQELAEEMAGK